ncbi:MAG TPA: hypothetical protein VJN96_20000 [Vicinamibacterales bacterium]|nr:hypothetical protein [Vicinamibacterales bacterium]
MHPLASAVVFASIVALFGWLLWRFARSRSWLDLLLGLAGLVAYVVLLNRLFGFPQPSAAIAKAGDSDRFLPLTAAMFTTMILGMAAEYLYQFLDTPRRKRRFDLGSLLKPMIVSPLVFMPLASSLQTSFDHANVDFVGLDGPRLMVFLVAFENGFLWRGYFSRKLAESSKAPGGTP